MLPLKRQQPTPEPAKDPDGHMQRVGFLCVLIAMLSAPLAAQVPTGAIAGTVSDRVGAVLPGAAVTVTNKATGASRDVVTGSDGTFSVPSLLPGAYDVLIIAPGFQPIVSPVDVATGATTTVKVTLEVSARTEAVTVTGTATHIDLESNRVQGVVGRAQIENLPLNGRSFLNLAALQPGVTVVIGNPAQFNAQFNVSVLGGPASRTAITVDGGNIRNPVEGGTGQNFSQEVVQEFQISTANFDLSTGIAAFGAINIGTLAPAPYVGNQLSGRVDYRINNKHSMFARYSHDGNTNSGPFGIPVPPSNFVSNKNYVDQQLVGITSVLSGTLVNDFRFSHMYWRNRNTPAGCDGDINGNCVGLGGPEIFYLNSVNFALGNNFNSPQGRDIHRYPVSNNTTWQKNAHQVKIGGTWEPSELVGYWGFFDPARVYLLSPEFLRGVGVPPAAFGLPDGVIRSYDDLKKLPVVTFLLGIGDRSQPSYNL